MRPSNVMACAAPGPRAPLSVRRRPRVPHAVSEGSRARSAISAAAEIVPIGCRWMYTRPSSRITTGRSEEHTSELHSRLHLVCRLLFFNDTATTEIYTLPLHAALPICAISAAAEIVPIGCRWMYTRPSSRITTGRSEEHTSELQSRLHLVCRLLLE